MDTLRWLWDLVTSAGDIFGLWPLVGGLFSMTAVWWMMFTAGVPGFVFAPAGLAAFLLFAHGVNAAFPAVRRALIPSLDISVDMRTFCYFKVKYTLEDSNVDGGCINSLALALPIRSISNHEDDDVQLDLTVRVFRKPSVPRVGEHSLDPFSRWSTDGPIAIPRKQPRLLDGGVQFDVSLGEVFLGPPRMPDMLVPESGVEFTWYDRNSRKSYIHTEPLYVMYQEPLKNRFGLQFDSISAYQTKLANGEVSSLARRPRGTLQVSSSSETSRPPAGDTGGLDG